MNKTNKIFGRNLLLSFLILLTLQDKAKATHAAGGEISYEWVSDSTYRIYFKFFRDCSGASPEPATINLCYRHSCSFSQPLTTLTLTKVTKLSDSSVNGNPVSPGCPPNATKCQNASSTVPGYREWWYTNTVTLRRCSLWTFSVGLQYRNPVSNLNNAGSTQLYVEATLNNVVALNNSSPYFSVKPVPTVCVNYPYTYNNGGVDPNSDSLVFEIQQPLQASGSCPYTPSAVPFATAFPTYNLTNNPMQTNNSFTFDTTTGQMTFTPSTTGSGTLTVRANEYRSGVFIGSVMRDIQVQVINCAVASPIANTVGGSLTGAIYANGRVQACAGVPMSFSFDLKSSDTAAILVASDNRTASAPGATTTYYGQLNDSIRGVFSWTPGTLDTGLRVFTVTAKDSTCISPGVSIAQTFVLPIYIWPVTDIIKDTSICVGDSVQLLAVGGSGFTWSVMSGGSPLSTLSCTGCKEPYAKPTVTTKYIVLNTGLSYCSKVRDTVTITVQNYSSTKPTASSNNPCVGNTLNLGAASLSGFSYSWTGPNSFTSSVQNPSISNAQTTLNGPYYVIAQKNGCYTARDTVNVTINTVPSAPTLSNNGPVCPGTALGLSASHASSSVTYSWTGPNGFNSSSQNPAISNMQAVNAGVYSASALLGSCASTASTTTVIVKTAPVIGGESHASPTTCNGTDGDITLIGLVRDTIYTISYKKNGVTQTPIVTAGDTAGKVHISNISSGIYSQIKVMMDGCNSDTIASITLADPTPPSITASSTNPTTCSGNSGTITLNGLTSGLVYSVNFNKNSTAQTPQSLTANASGQVVVPSLGAGTYTAITVTHPITGCLSNSVGPKVLTDPSLPVVSAGSIATVCQGDSIKLTASSDSSGVTWSWSGPSSFTSTIQNAFRTNALPAWSGTYSVTATKNNCISNAATASVFVQPTPSTPVAGSNSPLCAGGVLNLTASAQTGATYAWSGPNSYISVAQNPSVSGIDTQVSGIYSVIARINGCPSPSGSTVVTVYNVPSIGSSSLSNPTVCTGTDGSVTLSGLKTNTLYAINYRKNGIAQTPVSASSNGSGSVAISGLGSGIYSRITVTLNGCTSDTIAPVTLVDPNLPVVNAGNSTPICEGDTIKLTSSSNMSGVTWAWSGPGGYSSTSQNPSRASSLPAWSGTYSVTATKNNCTSLPATTNVLVKPTPVTPVATNNGPLCTGTTLSLSASSIAGASYQWVGPNSFSSISQNTGVSNMDTFRAGLYSVVATVNGCPSLAGTTTVVVHYTPVISSYSFSSPTTCSGTEGAFTLNGLIPNTSYTVNYRKNGVAQSAAIVTSTGAGKVILAGLNSATYSRVTVTLNSCTSDTTGSMTLSDPTPPAINSTFSNPTTCTGTEGYITLSGLTQGLVYTVNFDKNTNAQSPRILIGTASGTVVITGLTAGVYTNIRTTINNCTSNLLGPITLADPSAPTVTAAGSITVCEGDTIKLTSSSTSGATYAWTGPVSYSASGQNPSIINSDPSRSGNYTVTATLNNCTSLPATTSVLVKSRPSTPTAGSNSPICSGNILSLTASTVTNASYSWSGPSSYTSATQNNTRTGTLSSMTGTYSVIATVNGCNSFAGTVNVTVSPLPAPMVSSSSVTNPSTCNGANGAILLNGLNSNTSYVSNFYKNTVAQSPVTSTSNGFGQLQIGGLGAGAYSSITVTAPNGCTSDPISPLTLTDPSPAVIAISGYTHPTTCSGTNGTITLTGLAANMSYSINYSKNTVAQTPLIVASNSSGIAVMTGLTAGAYSAICASANSCISNSVGPAALADPLPPVITAPGSASLCESDSLKLTSSGPSGVSYSWTGPGSYTSNLQNPFIVNAVPTQSGTYTVTGVLNNCYSNSVSTSVTVRPTPATPAANNNGPLCEGAQLDLTASTVTGATYSWSGPGFSSGSQNPSITNITTGQAGTYSITATVNGCVSATGVTAVVVHPTPSMPGVVSGITYCKDDVPSVLTAVGSNILWYMSATGGIGNTVAPTPSTATAGITTWYATQTVNGCESPRASTTVTISIRPQAPVAIPDSFTYCQGEITVALQATGTNLKWYNQSTGGAGLTNTPTPSSANAGVFYHYVSQTNSAGCESERTRIAVTVSEIVKADIKLEKDTICQYDTIKVDNTVANPVTSVYTWSFEGGVILPGSSNSHYKVAMTKAGVRYVTVGIVNGGCHDSSTAPIFVKPAPDAIFELKDNVCVGDSLELIPYWVEFAQYVWSFDGGIIIDTTRYNTFNIKWMTPGKKDVSLRITGKNNCSSLPRIHTIDVHGSPDISITNVSRNDICTGDTIMLTASYNSDYAYQWLDSRYFVTNNSHEVLAEVQKTGYLSVNVKDGWGCKGKDSVMIYSKPCCDITLPDAFTPNGDGKNDKFRIITVGHHDMRSFYIVNRWGQRVFETNDELQSWDGTFRGVPQDMGSYFYFIKYKCSNDQVLEKNGEVILIR